MRKLTIKLGRKRAIAAITVVSMFLSVVATLANLYVFGFLDSSYVTLVSIFIAMFVPLIVAFPVAWFTVNMVFEIHKLEEEARNLVTYDALTGLLSRRAFLEQANYLCRLAMRQGAGFTILILDLDHFKKINDNYGHAAGDRVLETFGKIVRQISRSSDLAGRIGGEEFAFVLPYTTAEQALNFTERLHQTIRETVVDDHGVAIRFSVSIGVAFCAQMVTVEKAMALADKALYQAKKSGRNQSVIYNEAVALSITTELNHHSSALVSHLLSLG